MCDYYELFLWLEKQQKKEKKGKAGVTIRPHFASFI